MKFINLYVIFAILLTVFIYSCSQMNDLHQEYLDEGEYIYAAKVDSVASKAGKKRIKLEMFILSQRIEVVRIFWGNYRDSIDVEIGQQTGSVEKLIQNLEEKAYIFQLVSIDKYGNKSLPFEVTGNVYGEQFQSSIFNRGIASKTILVDGKMTITWSTAQDKAIRCELEYVNLSGEQVVRKVPVTEMTTVLADLASGLRYRTLFLPEAAAIDTFYTNYVTVGL